PRRSSIPTSSARRAPSSEQTVELPLARLPFPKALEADALDGARRGVAREPRLELADVAAPLADASLGRHGRRDDQVGALKADRVVAFLRRACAPTRSERFTTADQMQSELMRIRTRL